VTTIPNMMAISESKRLVDELRCENVPVRHLFVNQCQPENTGCEFCSVRHKEQAANLKYIQAEFSGLRIATVQSFDREIRGAAALRAMGAQLFPSTNDDSAALTGDGNISSGEDGTIRNVNGDVGTVIRPPPPMSTTTVAAEIVD
jgi:anion-transporting  ArsA/GET3 family ATPase